MVHIQISMVVPVILFITAFYLPICVFRSRVQYRIMHCILFSCLLVALIQEHSATPLFSPSLLPSPPPPALSPTLPGTLISAHLSVCPLVPALSPSPLPSRLPLPYLPHSFYANISKNPGQLSYILALNLGLSDCFLVIKLKLNIFGKNIVQVMLPSTIYWLSTMC